MTGFLGTDPNSGAVWAANGQVTNTQANQLLDWIEAIDRATEIRSFYINNYIQIGGNDTAVCGAYDPTFGFWVTGGQDFADGSSAVCRLTNGLNLSQDVTISDVGELTGIASNGAGTMVACGDTAVATATKLLSSTDGFTWTARDLSVATANECTAAHWDAKNSLFLVARGSTVEYSANGTTWTEATLIDGWSETNGVFVSNGTTAALLVPGSPSDSVLESSDGVNWYIRPVTTSNVTFRGSVWSQSDLLFFVTDGSTVWQSEDGRKWYTGDATLPSDVSVVYDMTSTSNHVLLAYGDGTAFWIAASDDGCRNWRKTCLLPLAVDFIEYSDGQMLVSWGDGVLSTSIKAIAAL